MLIFARHGETVYNKEHRFQGRSDSPLTEHGIKQAVAVGAELKKYNPSFFYISPLPRVFSTYTHMQSNNTPYQIVSDLAETCYGEWEEKRKDEIAELPAWIIRQKDRFNFVHPGEWHGIPGESYKQLYERLIPFFNKLHNLDERACCVILGHIGVMIAAKKFYEGHTDTDASKTMISNSTIFKVEKIDGNMQLTQKEVIW